MHRDLRECLRVGTTREPAVTPLSERAYVWEPRSYWRFLLCSRALFGGPFGTRLFVPPHHAGDLPGFRQKTEVVRSYRFSPSNSGLPSSFRIPRLPSVATGVHKSADRS